VNSTFDTKAGTFVGWIVSGAVVAGALVLGLLVIYHANYFPRTDDSEILANFIGIAPQVEGQVVSVPVHEGQVVRKGDLLFALDPRPFEHKVRILEARRVLAVQQVEQLKAELAASRGANASPICIRRPRRSGA